MTFNRLAGESIKFQLIKLLGTEQKIKGMRIGNIDKIAYSYYKNGLMNLNYEPSVKELSSEFLKFVQTKKGMKIVIKQYKFFFFDEFQDINSCQYDILKLFYQSGSIITVIGDDAQTIYQWRDAKLNIIQNQINIDIKNLKVYPLNENRRSTPEIVALGNEILKRSEVLPERNMIALKESEFLGKIKIKPQFIQFNDDEHQQNTILKLISNLLFEKGVQGDNIAIISYMNGPLLKIEAVLKQHNIKHPQKNIDFIIDAKVDNQKIKARRQKDWKKKISLCTIHCSKGLEWDYVFLIGCNDELIPGVNKDDTQEQRKSNLEEKRRLMYVAITRCSKYFSEVYNDSPSIFTIDKNKVADNEVFKLPKENEEIKKIKFITEAKTIVSKLDSHDLTNMRQQDLILSVDPKKLDLTNYNFQISPEIAYNQYELDLDIFLRLLVQNIFQNQIQKGNNIKQFDIYAEQVLFTIPLSQEMFEIYQKNYSNIQNAIKNQKKLRGDQLIIQEQILQLAKYYNIEYNFIRVIQEEFYYFPKNFPSIQKYKEAYKKFKNDKIIDINQNFDVIFKVSMMYMLYFKRNRLLFDGSAQKYFYEFIFKNDPIQKTNFISALDTSIKRILEIFDQKPQDQLHTALTIVNQEYMIECKIDLVLKNTIIMYKCSDYSVDDQLILLIQAALYMKHFYLNKSPKERNQNDNIIQIGIFNPLSQKFYGIGITGFETRIDRYLTYLYKIRNKITPLKQNLSILKEGQYFNQINIEEQQIQMEEEEQNINYTYEKYAVFTKKSQNK